MREFIEKYPLFSYISVPVLLVAFLVLTYLVLRPSGSVKNHFSRLYFLVLELIDFINLDQKTFSRDRLRKLLKMLTKIRHCYEFLENDELYEVESIIQNINKTISITKALLTTRASQNEVFDYLLIIDAELKIVRAALYSFSQTRDETHFPIIETLSKKKNKQKATDYLESLKND